jgi:hypothetical protein
MRHPGRVERPDEPESPAKKPQTQEERALRSLQAIFGGADLTAETTQLANEFTDRHSGRLTSWVKRKRGKPDEERA